MMKMARRRMYQLFNLDFFIFPYSIQVHSTDSLLKLVLELKRTAMFSRLTSLNENVDRRIEVLRQQAEGTERC
jgi:hypothetical protein